jgi:hypothetical protein
MLAQKPTDTTPAAEPTTVAPSDMQSAWQDISRLTGISPSLTRRRRSVAHAQPTLPAAASPKFQTIGDSFPGDFESTTPLCGGDDADPDQWLNEPLFGDASPYMTSPHDVPFDDFDLGTNTSPMDSPFSSFIATPSLRDMDLDMESPLIHDTSPVIAGLGFNSDLDLFGATAAFPTFEIDPTETAKPKLPATDKLWTFSPSSPALDTIAPAATVFAKPKSSPASAVIPPSPAPTPAPTRAPARRRVTATGTRKNLRPEALIPLDAPTQKRTYATPSATSRKAVPDAIVKKRLHSAAFAHEHDDDDDEDRRERAALGELSPTASEAEVIEYKRRQNTLAARKSRKRKLEHQQRLEGEVQDLKGELTMWRERALMAQELLKSAGVPFSFDA